MSNSVTGLVNKTDAIILAEPERPFWGFGELFLACAVFLAALAGAAEAAHTYFHAPAESGFWGVAEEAAAYAVLFLALRLLFARYGHGLLETLGWSQGPFSAVSMIGLGLGLSVIIVILQYALRTPNIETPFDKMLSDPASRTAIALFGISLGPLAEELLFRGLIQPVFVSAVGVLPGILITSALFGALHLDQNGFIWQSGVLIMLVGFVLGTVRHLSGSTRTSTIVHIAYNSLPFLSLLVSGDPLAK